MLLTFVIQHIHSTNNRNGTHPIIIRASTAQFYICRVLAMPSHLMPYQFFFSAFLFIWSLDFLFAAFFAIMYVKPNYLAMANGNFPICEFAICTNAQVETEIEIKHEKSDKNLVFNFDPNSRIIINIRR